MKFLLLILFVLSVPTAVLLSTILFTKDLNIILKQELSSAHIYDKANELLANSVSDDQSSQQFDTILKTVITPSYLQDKTEYTIDLSYNWILNKSTTPPSVSFIEIKDAILKQNPQLLNEIDSFANEAKNDPSMQAENPDQANSNAEMQKSIDSLVTLAHSDFTIKLDTYLIGLKNTYHTLKIALPILILIMFGELTLIIILSHTWKSRFLWLGLTFILSGLHGFGIIFLTNSLMKTITSYILNYSNDSFKLFSPIIIEIAKLFVNTYVKYQTFVSVIFIASAIVSFIAYSYLRFSQNKVIQVAKPTRKKK